MKTAISLIDNININLAQLNAKEKKVVLSLVKAFVESRRERRRSKKIA